MKIFVGLLAYNEEKAIWAVLFGIKQALTPYVGFDFKVLVVDDGSSDRTPSILHEAKASWPLAVIRHSKNENVGRGFRDLIEYVNLHADPDDYLFVMESDCTNDPALLPEMMRKLDEGYDVVVASRYRQGGRYLRFPFRRLILSKVANLILRVAYRIRGIKDYTIFFRGYRVGILKQALQVFQDRLITTSGFSANAELLCRVGSLGAQCAEVAFVYDYGLKDGKSKIQSLKTIREYLRLLSGSFGKQ